MTTAERRARVAGALRALGHDFVDHELDDVDLDALAATIEGLLDDVRRGGPRRRSDRVADVGTDVSSFHRYLAHDAVVAGPANPMGLGAQHRYEDDVAVMEVTIGRAFEGAPGRSHGGILATLVDETMGYVLARHGVFALTGWLRIDYRDAAPIGVPVRARAWLEGRDERKLTIRARVDAGEIHVADAEALFIAVDPALFAPRVG